MKVKVIGLTGPAHSFDKLGIMWSFGWSTQILLITNLVSVVFKEDIGILQNVQLRIPLNRINLSLKEKVVPNLCNFSVFGSLDAIFLVLDLKNNELF